ncbi:MAG: S-layer homology domain-containing protein [Chloroflexota bacterium]|nr:S-layer homology domain-containing protein [Chloroflexota bacterium]
MHIRRGLRGAVALLVLGMPALAGSWVAARPAALVAAQAEPARPESVAYRPAQPTPAHLTHPCGGMLPEPPYLGLSPLSITYVPGMCGNGYGDIGVWQAGGHSYVVLSGFSLRMFHIFNVDNPYAPVPLVSQSFPTGGTTSTSVFPFHQGANRYISVTMRGSGTGCGFFVYGVNDPANPQLVTRFQGTDWCTPHEHFVSSDANGDADYAWVAMSAESGSGYKVVALDLRSLPTITETGRYQRPDAGGSIFVHDATVIGNRVFVADWNGGVQIFDKPTLATSVNPTPLNPIDSIRPAAEGGVPFNVHHMWPTTDGKHLFIEDEFRNQANLEKIKIYNITDVTAPVYEGGIVGPDPVAQVTRAHNLKIQAIAPGHDRLYVGWYQAGTRGFEIDTTGSNAVVTPTILHQLKDNPSGDFGNVWGVDYLPCTLNAGGKALATTCVYSSDMTYGLVADALGEDPLLDPYAPEAAISDPVAGQVISGCSYTIRGNAHDYYSGVERVEVSTDGSTFALVVGTTAWTYNWTAPADGAYGLRVRARDVAGNYSAYAPAPLTVTVSGCTPATATPLPPTATATLAPPTATSTPLPPSTTATATLAPPTASATTVPPTATASATPSACSSCPTVTGTRTPNPSVTSTVTATGTASTPPTVTPTPTAPLGIPTMTATVSATAACTIRFSDVTDSAAYYYQGVYYLACHGVITGYADGTFRPYSNTTRAQVAKIVVLAFNISLVTPPVRDTFSDVDSTSVFYRLIETAAAHSFVTGYDCGGVNPQTGASEPCDSTRRPYYRPNNFVTRGQLAKIVALAAGWSMINPTTPTFRDVAPGTVFYPFVETSVCHGTLIGYNDGTFRPAANAFRGQIAKIVYGAVTSPAGTCGP